MEGIITTGLGKGAYFIGKEYYKKHLTEKCGFEPFPGTLNIIFPKEKLDEINNIKDNCKNIIKADKNFGGVKYIKATLNNEINGAIVFPEKTTHDVNYLEFIAKDKLRDKLNLEDGDKVKLEFNA